MTDTPHAKATDIPGWHAPPRVRDIPSMPGSWGWMPIYAHPGAALVQDDLGHLWIDGNRTCGAQARLAGVPVRHGIIAFFTDGGVGVYVYPESHSGIGHISRLDMDPDRWVPVAYVGDQPDFTVEEVTS